MPTIHSHCNGCKKGIAEDEEDVVQVIRGKSQIQGQEMMVEWGEELWFGHKGCYELPLTQAHAFLDGKVYSKLLKLANGDYNRDQVEELFKKNSWPMKVK